MSTSRVRMGFTLIELLVVIAIIAILAAILFPVFAKAREKSYQTRCTSNQRQIALAVQIYTQEHDEKLPDKSTVWQDLDIQKGILVCPTAGNKVSNAYAYNTNLSGVGLGEISSPNTAVLCIDSNAANNLLANFSEEIAARHAKGVIVACGDGHVAYEGNVIDDPFGILTGRGYDFFPAMPQVGSTLAGPFTTVSPGGGYSAPSFTNIVDMPTEMQFSSTMPTFKVVYTAADTAADGWGWQAGTSGLGIFLDDTPSVSSGLFSGSCLDYGYSDSGVVWYARGGVVGSNASMTLPTTGTKVSPGANPYEVTLLVYQNTAYVSTSAGGQKYSITSTDINNWKNKKKCAVVKSGPGAAWNVSRATVSDIKFYVQPTN